MNSDIKSLAKAIPGLNQQAQQRAQAAANVQLQQQLGATPRTMPMSNARATQQITPTMINQQGQIAQQGQQAQQQQLSQLAQQGLSQQKQRSQLDLAKAEMGQQGTLSKEKLQQQQQLSDLEISSRKQLNEDSIRAAQRMNKAGLEYDERLHILTTNQSRDLAKVGRDIQSKIFDSRLAFDRDEAGRKFTNERQLADYVAANSRDEQQARERLQIMQQQAYRKQQVLETAYNKISKALEQEMKKSEGLKDFKHQKELAEMKAAMQRQIQREQANAANKSAIIGAASTIAFVGGTAAAGGNPMGGAAAAGAVTAIGSQL